MYSWNPAPVSTDDSCWSRCLKRPATSRQVKGRKFRTRSLPAVTPRARLRVEPQTLTTVCRTRNPPVLRALRCQPSRRQCFDDDSSCHRAVMRLGKAPESRAVRLSIANVKSLVDWNRRSGCFCRQRRIVRISAGCDRTSNGSAGSACRIACMASAAVKAANARRPASSLYTIAPKAKMSAIPDPDRGSPLGQAGVPEGAPQPDPALRLQRGPHLGPRADHLLVAGADPVVAMRVDHFAGDEVEADRGDDAERDQRRAGPLADVGVALDRDHAGGDQAERPEDGQHSAGRQQQLGEEQPWRSGRSGRRRPWR